MNNRAAKQIRRMVEEEMKKPEYAAFPYYRRQRERRRLYQKTKKLFVKGKKK